MTLKFSTIVRDGKVYAISTDGSVLGWLDNRDVIAAGRILKRLPAELQGHIDYGDYNFAMRKSQEKNS